uniref:Uncharacterized protein n=1 Tax=Anguilla anguilla TaxID=7936 RepID=A0A0E9QKA3_ANGAN
MATLATLSLSLRGNDSLISLFF